MKCDIGDAPNKPMTAKIDNYDYTMTTQGNGSMPSQQRGYVVQVATCGPTLEGRVMWVGLTPMESPPYSDVSTEHGAVDSHDSTMIDKDQCVAAVARSYEAKMYSQYGSYSICSFSALYTLSGALMAAR